MEFLLFSYKPLCIVALGTFCVCPGGMCPMGCPEVGYVQEWGVSRGVCSGGGVSRGVCAHGVCVCPGQGCVYPGVCVQGDVSKGCVCPGGIHPWTQRPTPSKTRGRHPPWTQRQTTPSEQNDRQV